jgi:hypothetical protein
VPAGVEPDVVGLFAAQVGGGVDDRGPAVAVRVAVDLGARCRAEVRGDRGDDGVGLHRRDRKPGVDPEDGAHQNTTLVSLRVAMTANTALLNVPVVTTRR